MALAEELEDTEACGECQTRLGGLHLLMAQPAEAEGQLRKAAAVWHERADELTSLLVQRRTELRLQVR